MLSFKVINIDIKLSLIRQSFYGAAVYRALTSLHGASLGIVLHTVPFKICQSSFKKLIEHLMKQGALMYVKSYIYDSIILLEGYFHQTFRLSLQPLFILHIQNFRIYFISDPHFMLP